MKIGRELAVKLIFTGTMLAAGAAAWGLFSFVDPNRTKWMPQCFFYQVTHLYCPGCGATRALHALAHGDLAGSLRCNPLLLPLLGLGTLLVWFPKLGNYRFVAYGSMAVLLIFWIARNIPCYPFLLLTPEIAG